MKYKPVRLWAKTHHLAKMAAAQLDESLVEFIHRLVVEEIKRKNLRS